MQQVFNDGRLGEIQELFEETYKEQIEKAMSVPGVDHVRVFRQGGNKVGIPQIEDSILDEKVEALVEKKLDLALQKRDIINAYNDLQNNAKIKSRRNHGKG